MISIFENVREVANGYELDGATTSDLEYIERMFLKDAFYVLNTAWNAFSTGSVKSHERTYIIIFDIPARIALKLQIKERFFEIFSCLPGESFDLDDFLCEEYPASAYVEVNLFRICRLLSVSFLSSLCVWTFDKVNRRTILLSCFM